MSKSRQKKPSTIVKEISLIIILLLCFQSIVHAQSNEQIRLSENNIYLDAYIGLPIQVSFNYERQIYSARKVSWYARVGVGTSAMIFGASGRGGLGAITMLTGKKNSHFELNAGTFVGKDSYGTFVHPLFNIGYRYQKPEGGFLFRIYGGFVLVGISLGYSF